MAYMDNGGSVYLEGNEFGYYHADDPIYDYFGCIWSGDGGGTNNVDHLYGQAGTLLRGRHLRYMYGQEPDEYTDEIESAGGTIMLRCQQGHGRAVSWDGPDHDYRAIHSTFIFGATIDQDPPDTKAEFMARYMKYLYPAVVVTLEPDEVLIPAGGGLLYTVKFTNKTDEVQTLYWRANVYLPNGNPYSGNPVIPLTPLTLDPGASEIEDYSHFIPGNTPIGIYTYEVQVGGMPKELIDDDKFKFKIVLD
jgi:hypothetical protein